MAEIKHSPLAGRRILIVEDEFLVAMEISEALQLAGCIIVGQVGSINDALRVLGSEARLDAAVLDINLAGQPVFPVADALQRREIPFVFATGYSAAVIPAEYAEAPRCEKPVNEAMLLRILQGFFP